MAAFWPSGIGITSVTLWNASAEEKLGDFEVPIGFPGKLAFSPDSPNFGGGRN